MDNWKKAKERIKVHVNTNVEHKIAIEICKANMKRFTTGVGNDLGEVFTSRNRQIREKNTSLLKEVINAIRYLGMQGIPFHGCIEDLNQEFNHGNFLELLSLLSKKSEELT